MMLGYVIEASLGTIRVTVMEGAYKDVKHVKIYTLISRMIQQMI